MKTYAKKCPDKKVESSPHPLWEDEGNAKRTKITDFFFAPVGAKENQPSLLPLPPRDPNTARPRPSPAEPRERRSVQTRLNLGQRGLLPTVCECGFLFDEEYPRESQRHLRFHHQRTEIFQHASSRFGKTVNWTMRLANGDEVVRMSGRDLSPSQVRLVHRIDEEMSAREHDEEDIRALTVYLYVQREKDQVEGFMSTEPVARGLLRNPQAESDEDVPVDVLVGVSRIWVAPNSRRRGVAMKLLHSLRRCHHSSSLLCDAQCQMPPHLVAFSQPTTSGQRLACRFLARGADQFIYYR